VAQNGLGCIIFALQTNHKTSKPMNNQAILQKNLAIVNRGQNFGILFGKFTKNSEIHSVIFKAIKAGKATKLVDTEFTLMYQIN
jgi:hypothetical protein